MSHPDLLFPLEIQCFIKILDSFFFTLSNEKCDGRMVGAGGGKCFRNFRYFFQFLIR